MLLESFNITGLILKAEPTLGIIKKSSQDSKFLTLFVFRIFPGLAKSLIVTHSHPLSFDYFVFHSFIELTVNSVHLLIDSLDSVACCSLLFHYLLITINIDIQTGY
jgi:hypothetical protein